MRRRIPFHAMNGTRIAFRSADSIPAPGFRTRPGSSAEPVKGLLRAIFHPPFIPPKKTPLFSLWPLLSPIPPPLPPSKSA